MGENEQVNNNPLTPQVEDTQSTSQVCPEMDRLAEEAVAYCQKNDISNPSEILRVCQRKKSGSAKSWQSVRRNDPIHLSGQGEYSANGIWGSKRGCSNRFKKTLQVDFYGEVCMYYIPLHIAYTVQ